MSRIAKLLPTLLLAACAVYSPPAPDAPQAELVITSNLKDPPRDRYEPVHNMYLAYADGGCQKVLGGVAKFVGLFLVHPEEVVRVAAGTRIYIRADSRSATPAQPGQIEYVRNCYNLVSFVPEAGQRYEMRQTIGPGGACTTTVRNKDQPGPVQSYIEHPFEGECARQLGR